MTQPTVVVLVIVVVVVVALAAAIRMRSRRSVDGVDSFRRQIDALSPEARRPVIDQMYHESARVDTPQKDAPEQRAADQHEAEQNDSADPDPGLPRDDDTGGASGQDGAHGA